MQIKNLVSRSGVIVSTFMVAMLAFAMLLAPTKGNTDLKANDCGDAPTVATFNHWPVHYGSGTLPDCQDFPAIDAAKHTTSGSPVFSNSEADWNDGLTLNSGDNGIVRIYLHNGAANDGVDPDDVAATNVQVRTETDTAVGATHQVSVRFTADNAQAFNKTFTVKTPSNAKLELVPNSGQVWSYDNQLLQDGLTLGNHTATIPRLDACFEYSLFLAYRFKVVTPEQPANPTLTIKKDVRNINDNTSFADSVDAERNERVEYKIVVTNPSQVVARNVTVTDQSVSGISVESGSTTVEDASGTRLTSGLWQGAVPGTINLGDIPAGQSRVIKYTAKVTKEDCTTLTNTAYAQAEGVAQISDSAHVRMVGCGGTSTNPNIKIKKYVKNISTDTSYEDDSVNARTGERVKFKVTVSNTGNATLHDVIMTDVIPSGLQFDDSVTGDGHPSFNNRTFTVDFDDIRAGDSKTVEFAAKVLGTGSQTICNTAKARGDDVREVHDDACVKIYTTSKPGNPNITLSKRAWNDTKNVDATSTSAARGDYITYTLTTTNTGNANAVSYVISDDLSQVLPLADMIDLNGGTLNGNTISYPSTTITPGETVVKTFRVRIKTSLAPNLCYQLKNTYGNTVAVNVSCNTVYEAPKTGAAATSAAAFAGLVTAGFVALRKGRSIFKFIAN
jgi:uncharacterized repeat protein (TIGR01451 family)/fimbrial isopeptide formation D2 family protein